MGADFVYVRAKVQKVAAAIVGYIKFVVFLGGWGCAFYSESRIHKVVLFCGMFSTFQLKPESGGVCGQSPESGCYFGVHSSCSPKVVAILADRVEKVNAVFIYTF